MAPSDFFTPFISGFGSPSLLRPRHDCRGGVKTSQVPVVGLHTCLGSQTPRSPPVPRHSTVRSVLPSTHLTVSALRNTEFSALNVPARMHRCRRFTLSLAADDARLAEKRGWLLLSFRGTSTRYPSTSSPGAPSVIGIRNGIPKISTTLLKSQLKSGIQHDNFTQIEAHVGYNRGGSARLTEPYRNGRKSALSVRGGA